MPSTRTPRPVADQTRRGLLDAGRQIFSRDGFSRARTQDIVEAAGVAPTALYHHFENKAGLFVAVAREVYDIFSGFLARAVADEVGLDRRLDALVVAAARLHRSDPSLAPMAIVVQQESQRDEDLRRRLSETLRSLRWLAEDIARSTDGDTVDDAEVRSVSLAIIALLNGLSTVGATLRDPDEFVAAAASFNRVVRRRPQPHPDDGLPQRTPKV